MIIVGIDWARSKHDLVLMSRDGQVLERYCVCHDANGLNRLAAAVARHASAPDQVHVAVETHDGALLAFLLEQGYTVFGINPKSAQRARDRYRPAGGKDDVSDAFILADMLRTDCGSLRVIQPASRATLELRALVKLRAHRVQERTALFHRLRARLDEWCPDLSKLCNDFNRIWQRRLLERFPLQQQLHEVHGRTIHAFIRHHRLGADTAARIKASCRTVPMPIPDALTQTLQLDIQCLLKQIELITQTISELEKRSANKLEQHPDARLFQSLPVKGDNTIATLLAGFGEDRDLTPDHRALAAAWGVAPLTIQSGRRRSVRRRRAADRIMCQSLMNFAFQTAFTAGCWAVEFYQRKRQEGKGHYTALRCIAQRWLKILYRMWKTRTLYDERRHQINQQRSASRRPSTTTA